MAKDLNVHKKKAPQTNHGENRPGGGARPTLPVEPGIPGIPGVTGKLPFRPGSLLMTNQEQQDLAAVQYQPGDPVPGDLPEQLANARRAVASEFVEAMDERKRATHQAKIAKTVKIEDLPAEKQNELLAAMQQAKNNIDLADLQREMQRQQNKAFAGLDPSIREAMNLAAEPTEPGAVRTSKELFKQGAQPQPQPAQQPLTSPKVEPEATKEKAPLTCPHCQKDLQAPVIKPAYEDTFTYIQALLGEQEFKKVYVLIGGKVRITFRTPTSSQNEQIADQVQLDVQDGKCFTPNDVLYREFLYRLVFGLYTITLQGQTHHIASQVDQAVKEWDSVEPMLPALLEGFRNLDVIKNEIMWRLLLGVWRKFNDLVVALANGVADDPNFSEAIEV